MFNPPADLETRPRGKEKNSKKLTSETEHGHQSQKAPKVQHDGNTQYSWVALEQIPML